MDRFIQGRIEDRILESTNFVDTQLGNQSWYQRLKNIAKRYSNFILFILLVGFGIYAFYLSWKCSAIKPNNFYQRSFAATLAALLNIIYVIYYYLSRSDICHIMKVVHRIENKKCKEKIK